MEPVGSLPCSQEPSTGPYSEPDQSNPYHPILGNKIYKLENKVKNIGDLELNGEPEKHH
jgi:hypothetical protein